MSKKYTMKYTCILSALLVALSSLAVLGAANADVFTLEGPVKTNAFKQADFKWAVHLRHDYSKTYVTKFFLAMAEYDHEYRGKLKNRDNGKQKVYMNCEKAFEVVKGMDALTLGMPKIVYLVGWQYNGHDSKYPAFFEGCSGIARKCDTDPLDSIRWLMREAKKYHTDVSLHINLQDAYTDSPLFDEDLKRDVLAKDKDGNLIHGMWAYAVSYAAEWKAGLTQKRIDKLCDLLPIRDAGTIHIDACHNVMPLPVFHPDGKVTPKFVKTISPWHGYTQEDEMEAKREIVKYFDSKGIDVTPENSYNDVGGGHEGYFPLYWHYKKRNYALTLSAQQACGGNCAIKAFGDNVNGEALFHNNPDLDKAFEIFKREFCKTTLICQYLNTFGRQALIEGKGGSIGVFEKGVRTIWKDGRLSVAKDGEILSDGSGMLIPALWLGNGALVAYSEKGCHDRMWKVPSDVKLSGKANAWTVTSKGREAFNKFKIEGDSLTITLSPNEMALLQ